jgi:hypothetical protein
MKGISPNKCSVVVFHKIQDDYQTTLDLLYKVYSSVIIESKESNVISILREQQKNEIISTILLIDAESCTYKYPEECPEILKTIVNLLREGLLFNVVPVVCSKHDSPSFMIKCIQEGAGDYILKPLTEDVVKTLFLNVTRYRLQKNEVILNKVNQVSNIFTNHEQQTAGGQVWSKFKGRLKGVFSEEHWISKLIADYYTPKPSIKRISMASMLSDRKEYLEKQICSWSFLPIDLDMKDLIQCAFMILNQVLETFDELKSLRVPSGDLYHFLFDICNSYHSTNPYHNFRHAVDVLQANYYFLCQLGSLVPMNSTTTIKVQDSPLKSLLEPLDIFALLMASIGHDVGHPGVNNHFMVTTSTPLAILYNDKSVLESFHTMSFFHLVKEHCFSQLTDLRSNPNYAIFRKIVVNSILATDMSMHDEYVEKIKLQATRIKENQIDWNDKSTREKEKILLCSALIKCADISNCARPFEPAKRWAQTLAEEFFEQGDLERELGLPVLPINERGKLPLEDFQLSFIRFVAMKLFDSISKVTPSMQFAVDQMNENVSTWEIRKKEKREEQALSEKNAVSQNNPQPSPEGQSQRSRSGI